MKKLLISVLLLSLLTVCLVACGGESDTSTEETTTKEDATLTTTEETTTEETTTAPETTEQKTYPLTGKTFMFLGSSVTYGSAAGGYSFVDCIRSKGNCTAIKEAVSGTTLVDNDGGSYISRMKNNLDKNLKVDHFIVQLSTNDATQNRPLGKVSDSKNLEDFNTQTIIGAMEYIICYAQQTWECPVSFFTGTKYDSALYKKMVDALYDLQEKWDIGIIDLYNDEEMNAVSAEDYAKYMSDPIHPTLQGYLIWWTPKFIEHLEKYE